MPRLTLTARLKQLGYSSYNRYLASPHWREVRERYYRSSLAVRDAAGRIVCSRCRQYRQLALHHRTYDRLGREALSDLVALCSDCHDAAHGRKLKHPRRGLPHAVRSARPLPQVASLPGPDSHVVVVQYVECGCGFYFSAACHSRHHF